MPAGVQVGRLRISHLAGRVHDRMQVIGGPVAFAQRLTSLAPVQGLEITLPFDKGLPVDTRFWSRIAERSWLTPPMSEDDAPGLRRAGVPLRYHGTLTTAAEVPRLEVHLHPFGVVAITTVDLTWPMSAPVSLDQVWQPVQQHEGQSASVAVGGSTLATTLQQAAVEAAQKVLDLLTTSGQGQVWDLPRHRLATVISGVINTPPTVMPTANSPLHLALHRLSAGSGGGAVPAPGTAFVAQWNHTGYGWPTDNLVYMLDTGTATLSAEADPATPAGELTTADRHRWLLLLLAYISAQSGLVYAAQTSTSDQIREWAKTAANRLGLLFGPGKVYKEWGLVPQALMLRNDVSDDVQYVLGKPLEASANYQVDPYA